MNATLHAVYRRAPQLDMKLLTCACGTKTPRPGGVCGPCLRAGDILREELDVAMGFARHDPVADYIDEEVG